MLKPWLPVSHQKQTNPFFDIVPQRVVRLEFELAWDESDNAYAVIAKT